MFFGGDEEKWLFCNKTRGQGKKPKTPSPMTTRWFFLFVVLVIVPFFYHGGFCCEDFPGLQHHDSWNIRYGFHVIGGLSDIRGLKKPHGEPPFLPTIMMLWSCCPGKS